MIIEYYDYMYYHYCLFKIHSPFLCIPVPLVCLCICPHLCACALFSSALNNPLFLSLCF